MALTEAIASSPYPQFADEQTQVSDGQGLAKPKMSALLADIISKKTLAQNSRSAKESQWRTNLMQFRGQDTSEFRKSEHSKVSLRTTAVKTKAALSQIIEALLANGKFPLSIKETRVPEGSYEFAHIHEGGQSAPEEPKEVTKAPEGLGYAGDGRDLLPGASFAMLGGMFAQQEAIDASSKADIKEGAGMTGEITVAPAKEAAYNMEKAILDQLESSKINAHINSSVFEACILGSGALKGPFNEFRTLPRWTKNEQGIREYTPEEQLYPKASFVSLWDLFIDPSCQTDIRDAEWVIERHKMNMVDLRNLKRRPLFNKKAIDNLAMGGPNYVDQSNDQAHDAQLVDTSQAKHATLWEVWEYWGYMETYKLTQYGLRVPEGADDYVQVNVWFSGDHVLRVTLNPFKPARIPYYVFPYERDPYSVYGIGVPELMADQQKLMNGFMRMAVDNLALAGNMVFDIDETALAPGQSAEIEPGKIFRRVSGSPGQAVFGIKFPNTANENLQMVREVRQHADETTGIPSISHGQTGVSGFGRTSSGMSMILNNASLNIKSVVRNIDDHLIVPLGQAMFSWNMQFKAEDNPDIEGDLEIKATGASGLEMKDVESQRLQTFLQLSMNPAVAPLIKLPTIVKRLAQVMDMAPEEIMNNPEEAQFYAQLMGQQAMQQTGNPQGALAPAANQGGQGEGAGNPEGLNGNVEGVNSSQGM